MLSKYFSENDSIIVARGQPILACSERQILSVLEVISDESVAVSVRTMKSLMTEAMKAGATLHNITPGTSSGRAGYPFSKADNSVDGGGPSGNITDKYTSGALSSDDDFVTGQTAQRTVVNLDETPERTSPTGETTMQTHSPLADIVPSPGYSAADYQPLSHVCLPSPEKPDKSRPACKRSRIAGRRGKVMRDAYFKGIK